VIDDGDRIGRRPIFFISSTAAAAAFLASSMLIGAP
jgi:hypothetical protein